MHGTDKAYQKHLRDGTVPCDACRTAHADAAREWRQGRRGFKPAALHDLICDVLETFGPMTARGIVDNVLRIKPGVRAESVKRAMFRLDLERVERGGEVLYRL